MNHEWTSVRVTQFVLSGLQDIAKRMRTTEVARDGTTRRKTVSLGEALERLMRAYFQKRERVKKYQRKRRMRTDAGG